MINSQIKIWETLNETHYNVAYMAKYYKLIWLSYVRLITFILLYSCIF